MSSTRQAGRPSKAEETDIKLTLWPYFVDGCKTAITAEDTEIPINTVKRHFRIWSAKIFKNEEKEFFRTCKIAKERTLLKIDERLKNLENLSDKLEQKLGDIDWNLSPKYAPAQDRYAALQVKIAKLELEKYNLESLPTADMRLKVDLTEITKEKNPGGHNNA